MSTDDIVRQLESHATVIEQVKNDLPGTIADCAMEIAEALRRGNKILVMGNGGSAADAQHLAAEMVGRFMLERKGLPAVALTTDSSILTAVSNDYGFAELFRRQVEALAQPGDVVIGISTSGNSENVCRALQLANDLGCRTIALSGRDGGVSAGIASSNIIVKAADTPRIQEAHLVIVHLLCDLVEKQLALQA